MMNEWAKHLDKFGSGTIVLMLKYMLLPGSLYGCSNNGEASNCLVTNHNIMKNHCTTWIAHCHGKTSSRLHQSKIVFHLVIY